MKRKLFTFLLAIVASIGLTRAEIYSGTCGATGDGSNVQWSLDTKTGILDIMGTGNMKDFNWRDPAPWKVYKDQTSAVIIQEGVTSVSDYAFESFILDSLVIPSSLQKLGKGILSDAKINKMSYNATSCADYNGCNGDYFDKTTGRWFSCGDCNDRNTPLYYDSNCVEIENRRPVIQSFIIGDNVIYIPAWLCYGLGINIEIPCNVTGIGKNAFDYCNVFRNCGNTERHSEEIYVCKESDLQLLPQWLQDTIQKKYGKNSLEW